MNLVNVMLFRSKYVIRLNQRQCSASDRFALAPKIVIVAVSYLEVPAVRRLHDGKDEALVA